MTVVSATSSAHRPWGKAIASVLGLVLLGTVAGLVSGLVLVHALALLGLQLDTSTGQILRQAFS